MASAQRFGLFSCSTISGSAVTTIFTQIDSFDIIPGASRSRIYVAGSVDPKAHIEAFSDPRIRFGTRDQATYWGVVSPTTGLALTGAGATFRLQERESLAGVFGATNAGDTFTVAQGIVIPQSISAQQDDAEGAIIESELVCESNGSVLPIVKNTAVDISSGSLTPAFVSQFFMGPVYVNGSEIPGIISTRVDFGIQYSSKRTSGQVYPTLGAIVQRSPMISITTLKADATTALAMFLRALSGTIAVYFWKAADAGNRIAVATTSNLKISAAAGSWGEDSISVKSLDDATTTISIMPTGTLALSVASAIP